MQSGAEPVIVLMVDDDDADVYSAKRAFREGKIVNDFRHVSDADGLFDYLDRMGDGPGSVPYPRPHVILLDINMPGLSGLEVLKTLKQNELYRSIPVVVLTTSDEEHDVSESYALGASSYITKPVSVEGMMNMAQRFEEYWFQMVRIPKGDLGK